ncbi:MAG: protein translocase subunit SecF [Arenicella sp.]
MEMLAKTTNIDFLGKRKITGIISAVLIAAGIFSLFTQGLNLSIDFTGGSVIEVSYEKPADLESIRQKMSENGFEKAVVQNFGSANDVLIRVPVDVNTAPSSETAEGSDSDDAQNSPVTANAKVSETVFKILQSSVQSDDKVTLKRVEFVGPQFGQELVEKGVLALIYALGFVLVYVAFRFEWKFGIGSVAALVHDVLITIGVFAIIQMEFSLAVLAAVLAVIGYSLNDTIVVFDRIRENFRKMRETDTVEIMNVSVNQTLPRTILTSVTTLLVLFALFVFGGDSLKGFSVALIIGVLIGTYSSIFVASPVVLALGVSKKDLMIEKVEKEGADQVDLDLIP